MKRKLADENDNSSLSEYERIRLKNIEERQQKLLSLGIAVNAPSAPTKKARILIKFPSSSKTTTTPVRFSTRLRGIETDTVAKSQSSEHVIENVEEIKTIPRRDLCLNELLSLESNSEQLEEKESSLKTFLNSFSLSLKLKHHEKTKFDLSTLKINEDGAFKVIPSRITSMAFHNSLNPLILSIGDKYGNLSIWNLNHREQVHSFRLHDRNLNCMSFDQYDSVKLITTSYDGTVRQFDMKSMEFRLLFGTDESFTSYHSQVDANQYLITQGKGYVGLLDIRKEKNTLASKIEVFSNNRRANTISYKDNLFVCGNSKSECLVYDLRKSNKPYLELLGHKGSVQSAFFNPSSVVPEVLTTDSKNKIRLFDLSKTKANVSPTWSLTHNNLVGRWLTPFRAVWHPTQSYIFVGSMKSPRQLDVFDSKGNRAKTLTGEWLTSTASVVIPHPYANIIAGGNSSGKVFIFEG